MRLHALMHLSKMDWKKERLDIMDKHNLNYASKSTSKLKGFEMMTTIHLINRLPLKR